MAKRSSVSGAAVAVGTGLGVGAGIVLGTMLAKYLMQKATAPSGQLYSSVPYARSIAIPPGRGRAFYGNTLAGDMHRSLMTALRIPDYHSALLLSDLLLVHLGYFGLDCSGWLALTYGQKRNMVAQQVMRGRITRWSIPGWGYSVWVNNGLDYDRYIAVMDRHCLVSTYGYAQPLVINGGYAPVATGGYAI